MTESIKNRNLLPIGTRVRPAYDKLSERVGEVVDYTEDGQSMCVLWDGFNYPQSYMVAEIRPIRKGWE